MTAPIPVVGPIVAAVEAIEEAIVTPRERLARDHGFEFVKTGNGYAWSVVVDGERLVTRWRSRHSPQAHRQALRDSIADAQRLTK